MQLFFISQTYILPRLPLVLSPAGRAITLIKPQFEAGRADVGRGGLVKDPKVHLRVLRETVETFKLNGFTVAGLTVSPIHGGDGNIEFLAWLRRKGQDNLPDLEALVRQAHSRK